MYITKYNKAANLIYNKDMTTSQVDAIFSSGNQSSLDEIKKVVNLRDTYKAVYGEEMSKEAIGNFDIGKYTKRQLENQVYDQYKNRTGETFVGKNLWRATKW